MSSKPKKSDYGPSAEETALAKISSQEQKYYQQKYSPKIKQAMEAAMKEDITSTVQGRAQADVMQALSSKPSLQAARSVDAAADMASAASAQQLQAGAQALAGQKQRQVGALGLARGEAGVATQGLSQAARVATTSQLAEAQRKQMVREAKLAAGAQLAGAAAGQGFENIAGGGSFFTPKALQSPTGDLAGMSGFQQRLATGIYGSYDPITGLRSGPATNSGSQTNSSSSSSPTGTSYEDLAISGPSSSIVSGYGG
jgi:hypothetical protein